MSFFRNLWNYPEAVFHIIKNSDYKIIQTNLAPFIVNNFYCDYLSGNYIENNLLFVITMMLKEEIDGLQKVSDVDKFLEKTKCGMILEEMRNMPDVQIYFKNLIYKTVENMERTCSFREISFNAEDIYKKLNKLKKTEEKKLNKVFDEKKQNVFIKLINNRLFDPNINYSKYEGKVNDIFMKKYIAEIDIKEFEKNADEAKKQNNNNLYDYFNKLKNDIKINNDLYSNSYLINNMLETKLGSYMLLFYKNNFLDMISYINQLIDNINKNILLLPNSIKYICKIISILIRNKFKTISVFEENSFISKFLIEKILIPIISSPSQNALISDFIISGNTLKNIETMSFILKKLFSEKLFLNNSNEGNYTPFNWLIMEKIETILYIFDKTKNVNLPNFIQKYIKNELPKNYYYDYFEENKEVICANIGICFTLENLDDLIKGLEKSDYIFTYDNPKSSKLKRFFDILKSKSTMDRIKECDIKIRNKNNEKNLDKNTNIQNYYLYKEILIEEKYAKLFSFNNTISNFYISLKEEEKKNKINETDKKIIKIKNYLCTSLANFRLLNKSDFNDDAISNTIKMLNEIKLYMSLPNFILSNNTIPCIWYINSILDNLDKIPDNYKEYDYRKLFTELTQSINDSINSLDFERLILFRNKLKFLEKMNDYYQNVFILRNNIVINENIKLLVEGAIIPVKIIFKYVDKLNEDNIFEIEENFLKKNNEDDKIIYERGNMIFKTIEAFTRYFPDLSNYQNKLDISSLDIIKELEINKKINEYFSIIKNRIIQTEVITKEKYDPLYKDKIKDYIMNKIYEKIYPPDPDDKDNIIFQKSIKLSWVEPHLILNKDYIFDDLLPDILNEFSQINKVKTPNKKLNCIKKIMSHIENIIKFNEGIDKEIGAEDITPVLNYIFIKAQPIEIYTDVMFTKLFSENDGEFENCLINFQSMCDVIINTNNSNFNLTPEEYNKKCIEAINNLKSHK